MWKLVVLLAAACSVRSETFTNPSGDAGADAVDAPPRELIDVPAGDMQGPVTWSGTKAYALKGFTFVTSGTLTIEPGALVLGDPDSALVILKDAKLVADGTPAAPIVFTSSQPSTVSRDWGGVVLIGRAPNNAPAGLSYRVPGFKSADQPRVAFGGTDVDYNCGTLRYVRIEYAGTANVEPLEPFRNAALTLAGCGAGTTIDYVQLHRNSVDGVDIYGGNAFLRHLVVTHAGDDALSWNVGWTGRLQFLITQQRPGAGDKAIEGDSGPLGQSEMPRSTPEMFNLTLVGANGTATDPQGGIRLGSGTDAMIKNVIAMGFPKFAVDIDGTETVGRLTGQPGNQGQLYINNAFFLKAAAATSSWPADFDGVPPNDNDGGFDEAGYFSFDPRNRLEVAVNLGDPFNLTAPSWKPATDSPVLGSCASPAPAGFDVTATFCGAVGATDWTMGWTRYSD